MDGLRGKGRGLGRPALDAVEASEPLVRQEERDEEERCGEDSGRGPAPGAPAREEDDGLGEERHPAREDV